MAVEWDRWLRQRPAPWEWVLCPGKPAGRAGANRRTAGAPPTALDKPDPLSGAQQPLGPHLLASPPHHPPIGPASPPWAARIRRAPSRRPRKRPHLRGGGGEGLAAGWMLPIFACERGALRDGSPRLLLQNRRMRGDCWYAFTWALSSNAMAAFLLLGLHCPFNNLFVLSLIVCCLSALFCSCTLFSCS